VGRGPRVRPYVVAYAEEVLGVLKLQDRDVEFLRQREDLDRGFSIAASRLQLAPGYPVDPHAASGSGRR
jgi:hypothetical protein